MTVEEWIHQIEVVNLELAKEKNAFDRWGLYVLKSTLTDHLIKLIKEMKGQLPPNKFGGLQDRTN